MPFSATRHLSAWLLTLLLANSATAQRISDSEQQQKIDQLQQTIEQLKTELSRVKSSRDQLQHNLESSEVDIGQLLQKIERLQEELGKQKKRLTQLNQQRDELQHKKRQQQQLIGQQINAAYRLGGQSQIKLLLNQQHPDQVARTLKYYQYFTDARADKIDTYLDTVAELDTLQPKIEAKAASLQRNRDTLQKRRNQLEQRQQQRQNTLAQLNASIADKDQQLQQDQQRLETLLQQVTAAIADLDLPGDGKSFMQRKGAMALPSKGRIRHRFGSPRVGAQLPWEGIVIEAGMGSSIQAIHHGRVVFSDYLRGHGMLIILDHGDGYLSLYAHNQALLKETGDWVSAGEAIAKMGNSGGRSRAGVYFEVRHQGKPSNPLKWCRSKKA